MIDYLKVNHKNEIGLDHTIFFDNDLRMLHVWVNLMNDLFIPYQFDINEVILARVLTQ